MVFRLLSIQQTNPTNNRMQSDKLLHYASQFAADVGRYAE